MCGRCHTLAQHTTCYAMAPPYLCVRGRCPQPYTLRGSTHECCRSPALAVPTCAVFTEAYWLLPYVCSCPQHHYHYPLPCSPPCSHTHAHVQQLRRSARPCCMDALCACG